MYTSTGVYTMFRINVSETSFLTLYSKKLQIWDIKWKEQPTNITTWARTYVWHCRNNNNYHHATLHCELHKRGSEPVNHHPDYLETPVLLIQTSLYLQLQFVLGTHFSVSVIMEHIKCINVLFLGGKFWNTLKMLLKGHSSSCLFKPDNYNPKHIYCSNQ